jgi:16S rRNA (cytosine967-C5)-methyltransferase
LAKEVGGADAAELLCAFLIDLGGVPPPDAQRLARLPSLLRLERGPFGFADAFSLPDWLAAELTSALNDPIQAPALAASLNLPGPICVRANLLRTTRASLANRLRSEGVLTRPCQFSALGLVCEGRPNIFGSPAYREGLFEVQDEGSQLLGLLVGARPGESVLDLCAGAGGKSLLLAVALEGRGELHVHDLDPQRLDRLLHRAERAGVRAHVHRAAPPPSLCVGRILVDAPCSELGALRRGPDVRWRLSPSRFPSLRATQLELCESALAHLAPGGTLVYATCTFRAEENEELAAELERRHPYLRRVDPRALGMDPSLSDGGFFKSWPHQHGTDAFFAAIYELGPRR